MKYENCLAENELYRNSSTWSDHADDMTLRLTFDLTFFINQPSLSINLLHQLAFFLNKLSLSINILYVGWLSSLAQLLRLFVLFQILGGTDLNFQSLIYSVTIINYISYLLCWCSIGLSFVWNVRRQCKAFYCLETYTLCIIAICK